MSGAQPLAAEVALSPADFATIARLVHTHSGIVLNDGKRPLVFSRLAKHVRRLGLADFAAYVKLLASDADVCRQAVFALTTNHTRFFREDHHFKHFADVMRPALIARAARGERVRLWSSASSSGEEPYSLAMTLLGADREAGNRLLRHDVAILATDLAPHVLATAKAGRYPDELARDMPEPLRRAWTRIDGGEVVMAPELRRLVSYRHLNLLGPWPMSQGFDAIFCRNVMIYFDEPTKARLLERFAELLAPGAFLYIGHSERVIGPAAAMFETVGQTIYRKLA